jgi:inner membrane protein
MRWISHIAIASATTAIVAPPLIPFAVLGATAPDWSEKFFQKQHRQETHYVILWIGFVAFFLLIWDYKNIGLAFAYGGLTHVLLDSLTVTGVPFAPWSKNRFHLFGGRLKTGSSQEYIIAGVICIASLVAFQQYNTAHSGYIPFFFNWIEFYEDGLLDAKEWKNNRFKFL